MSHLYIPTSNVIAILKPGKDGTDTAHYRPISLLTFSVTVTYKVLERLKLNNIEPIIDKVVTIQQTGIRHHRG